MLETCLEYSRQMVAARKRNNHNIIATDTYERDLTIAIQVGLKMKYGKSFFVRKKKDQIKTQIDHSELFLYGQKYNNIVEKVRIERPKAVYSNPQYADLYN